MVVRSNDKNRNNANSGKRCLGDITIQGNRSSGNWNVEQNGHSVILLIHSIDYHKS